MYLWVEAFWGMQKTADAIFTEGEKAIQKHGLSQTPLNSGMDPRDKLVILIEEVGEVARALTYDEGDDGNLKEELIQVATMAAMWAGSL